MDNLNQYQQPDNYRIAIFASALREMVSHCRSLLPHEACGVLAGSAGRIESVWPIGNRSTNPESAFSFDPQQWTETYYRIRSSRQSIAGFFHSHPAGTVLPSASDVAGWPRGMNVSYWIVALQHKKPASVHVYRMNDNRFVPLVFTQISV